MNKWMTILEKCGFWKFSVENPSVDFFNFYIFWKPIPWEFIWCWHSRWKPKLNLRTLMVRCAFWVSRFQHTLSGEQLSGMSCTLTCRKAPDNNPLPLRSRCFRTTACKTSASTCVRKTCPARTRASGASCTTRTCGRRSPPFRRSGRL